MLQITSVAVVLAASLLSGVGQARPDSPNRYLQSEQAPARINQELPRIREMKVLAQGSHSVIGDPFVAVCRDSETYLVLRKLDSNLPVLGAEFFKSHALIAAYLGTRNTGGYSVEIKREGDPNVEVPSPNRSFFHVIEKSPAKGAIVPQVVTSPFIVVSVGVEGTPPLILSLDYAWRQKQQLYRIKRSSFTMTGGFAGSSEQFEPHGEWLTLHADGLVSFYISMAGTGAKKERFMSDFATAARENDQITIRKLTGDFFVDRPNNGLTATGTLRERDGKLSLHLVSLPSIVADGYRGEGSLEAELVRSTKP